MQNVLITGGAGFIGSNFIRHLLQTEPGVKVVNLDALTEKVDGHIKGMRADEK